MTCKLFGVQCIALIFQHSFINTSNITDYILQHYLLAMDPSSEEDMCAPVLANLLPCSAEQVENCTFWSLEREVSLPVNSHFLMSQILLGHAQYHTSARLMVIPAQMSGWLSMETIIVEVS